jgi:hypothetical protein
MPDLKTLKTNKPVLFIAALAIAFAAPYKLCIDCGK